MAAASNIVTPPTEPIVVPDDPPSVLAKSSWLTPTDLAAFSCLRIPLDLLLLAGVQRVTDHEAREKYGIRGPATSDMSGIVFPYFNVATGARVTARVRRDNPETPDRPRPVCPPLRPGDRPFSPAKPPLS